MFQEYSGVLRAASSEKVRGAKKRTTTCRVRAGLNDGEHRWHQLEYSRRFPRVPRWKGLLQVCVPAAVDHFGPLGSFSRCGLPGRVALLSTRHQPRCFSHSAPSAPLNADSIASGSPFVDSVPCRGILEQTHEVIVTQKTVLCTNPLNHGHGVDGCPREGFLKALAVDQRGN
jgi:hypothetical protein